VAVEEPDMTADYKQLMQMQFPDVHQAYTERDSMLYALSLGVGGDPIDAEQLKLVYEKDLHALPTMCVVLAHPGFWPRDLNTGLDYTRIVHGGQRLTMHRSLPPAGEVIGRSRIREIIDKGAGKGALVYFERTLSDASNGDTLCTLEQTLFCRGDGGMGGSGQQPPAPHPVPERSPDFSVNHQLLPQSALLYRLNGDMNPLHADPDIAAKAGFDRPILQGLATYGIAGLALINSLCGGVPERLLGLDVRFTAPVYPGETLLSQIWREGGTAAIRVSVPARGVVAIDGGKATLAVD
jgi:acyl dehydratase